MSEKPNVILEDDNELVIRVCDRDDLMTIADWINYWVEQNTEECDTVRIVVEHIRQATQAAKS